MTPAPPQAARLAPLAALAACVLAAVPAVAQNDRFREIEPGYEDVSPLAENQRLRRIDLRTPVGFDRVYEVLGSDGLFARRSGAVTAVFDRSFYARGLPVIPPGTVFYVGDLPVDLDRPGLLGSLRQSLGAGDPRLRADTSATAPRAESRVLERADLRVDSEDARGRPPLERTGLTMWNSEEYRQRRVGELIRGAAWRWRAGEAAAGR